MAPSTNPWIYPWQAHLSTAHAAETTSMANPKIIFRWLNHCGSYSSVLSISWVMPISSRDALVCQWSSFVGKRNESLENGDPSPFWCLQKEPNRRISLGMEMTVLRMKTCDQGLFVRSMRLSQKGSSHFFIALRDRIWPEIVFCYAFLFFLSVSSYTSILLEFIHFVVFFLEILILLPRKRSKKKSFKTRG